MGLERQEEWRGLQAEEHLVQIPCEVVRRRQFEDWKSQCDFSKKQSGCLVWKRGPDNGNFQAQQEKKRIEA